MTDNSYLEFLNSWREENKPRVIMFDVASNIPLLYKVSVYYINCSNSLSSKSIFLTQVVIYSCTQLTAFAYKDYVRFGYVDMGLTETSQVVQSFNINTYAPTMLLFKENTEKPADVIQVKPCSPFANSQLQVFSPLLDKSSSVFTRRQGG